MQSHPALPILLKHADFGSHAADTAAMDLFVMINLGFLFLMLAFFGVCAWMIWRRTVHPEPHMQLIMELEQETSTPELAADDEQTPPWERSADWWKQQDKP
jgi:hypothetical protein